MIYMMKLKGFNWESCRVAQQSPGKAKVIIKIEGTAELIEPYGELETTWLEIYIESQSRIV